MNRSLLIYSSIFILVSLFLFKGLYYDPKKIQSPLIGKTFPNFELYDLDNIANWAIHEEYGWLYSKGLVPALSQGMVGFTTSHIYFNN